MVETARDVPQSVTVVTTRRQYGLYCWGLIVTLILLAVLVIVAAILLLTSHNSVLVLSVFIVVLLIVGVSSCIFIEWQRRQASKSRDQGAREWIQRSLSKDKLPSAPQESASSSWMFWRKTSSSNGSALAADQRPVPSAPPLSARSSWTVSRKSYLPVYKAENTVR